MRSTWTRPKSFGAEVRYSQISSSEASFRVGGSVIVTAAAGHDCSVPNFRKLSLRRRLTGRERGQGLFSPEPDKAVRKAPAIARENGRVQEIFGNRQRALTRVPWLQPKASTDKFRRSKNGRTDSFWVVEAVQPADSALLQ